MDLKSLRGIFACKLLIYNGKGYVKTLYEPLYKQAFPMYINDLRGHYCINQQLAVTVALCYYPLL